jgi:hypothetical protein
MSGLVETCGGQASVAIIHLTLAQGVAVLLATLVVGILASAGLHRWLEEGDEQIALALRAAEDESLEIAATVMAPYPGQIPVQRVTNGEDLLGGGPR